MANASDIPEERSVVEFVNALEQHSKVAEVAEDAGELTVRVVLKSGHAIRVRMTNIYCVGEADVRELLAEDPLLDAVVTLSAWNLVSGSAGSYGAERRVGVFTWKQFFGAINYQKFWLYVEMPYSLEGDALAAERRRRRREWN